MPRYEFDLAVTDKLLTTTRAVRKRFERLREKLRKLAKERGLLDS